MNKTLFGLVFFILFISSCKSKPGDKKLMIVAAASTQFAVKELAKEFEEKYNTPTEVIIGSSGKLTAQIINGAPFDVFISADTFYPNNVTVAGRALKDPYVYSKGVPVVWSLNSGIGMSKLKATLLGDEVKKIAIADPKNAPYGRQAVKFLKDIGVYHQVKSKLVFGENISQVNEYVLSKSVQLGFTAKSILLHVKLKGKGQYKTLGQKYHIDQALVLIKNGKKQQPKNQFLEFVQSARGHEILNKFGYIDDES